MTDSPSIALPAPLEKTLKLLPLAVLMVSTIGLFARADARQDTVDKRVAYLEANGAPVVSNRLTRIETNLEAMRQNESEDKAALARIESRLDRALDK